MFCLLTSLYTPSESGINFCLVMQHVKQEGAPFVVMGMVSLGLATWRALRFLEPTQTHSALVGAAVCAALTVLNSIL